MQYKNASALPSQMTTALTRSPLPVLVARLVGVEVGGLLRRLGRVIGGSPRNFDLQDLAIPDCALARRATELARTVEPDFLFNHSVRSYLFGAAIGRELDLRPDWEVLYVACILHDLGLVPQHNGGGSFELDGARAAHAFATEQGMDEERAFLVHEAIALHTSVGIAGQRDPEIALLHFGAGVDVIGYRSEDISSRTRQRIVAAYPREALKTEFERLMDEEVARKPDCHFSGLHRLGFGRMLSRAPFEE